MEKDKNDNLPSLPSVSAFPSGTDGLSRYLVEIRKFPLLEPEEEYILAKRWQEHHDPKAAERIISSHLRLVAKVANGYRGYGLPIADLIAEGNIGLMQALKRFEPDKGFRFSTYAMWWVRANIQEYILHSWSLVKMGTTSAQKKLFFNLRRLKREMQDADEIGISDELVKSIAAELNVTENEVREMNKRMSGSDQSLNVALRDEGGGEWQDWLVDERTSQENNLIERNDTHHKNSLLDIAMEALNERESYVIKARRLAEPPETLEAVSEALGVSRERVRQIEIRAFEKLQRAVKTAALQQRILVK